MQCNITDDLPEGYTLVPEWALGVNLTNRDFRIYLFLWRNAGTGEITTDVEKTIADALDMPFGKIREAVLRFTDIGLVTNRDAGEDGTRGAFLVIDDPLGP